MMEKKFDVIPVNSITVEELKKLIADLPSDYVITCCGMKECYINILHADKYVTIDTENLNEYYGYEDEE